MGGISRRRRRHLVPQHGGTNGEDDPAEGVILEICRPRGDGVRMKIPASMLLACFFLFAAAIACAQSQPVEVTFPSGGRQLHGFLWKPAGDGPFRAIVWNHGSE